MKKIIWWIILLTILIPIFILISIILVKCLAILLQPYEVTGTTISVQQASTDNANLYQNNAAVDLFPVEGELYYYVNCWPGSLGLRSKFDRKLCAIEDGKIHVLQDADELYGSDDQFIYTRSGRHVVAYNTQLNSAKKVLPLNKDTIYHATFTSDGVLRLFEKYGSGECYTIQDGKLIESDKTVPEHEQYEIGGKLYFVQDKKLFCQGEDISKQIGSASYRALIPYQDGLLLINDGYGSLVYYIREDGTIQALFPEFECMCSTSSVNFYENYVFVSFKRWKSYDESGIALKSYENDSLEGTYRIDIRDGSVEKISDNIYDGMFIFDNSGIFACDRDGDISKLDFNGMMLQAIVD